MNPQAPRRVAEAMTDAVASAKPRVLDPHPEAARGRHALSPWGIPWPGFKDVGLRVFRETKNDYIGLIAAGCAFYGLLAIFPAIAASIAIWGLLADPATIVGQIDGLTRALPGDAAAIIKDQAAAAAGAEGGAALTALLSIAVGIYSASKGMKSLTTGLNIAYDEAEERSFIKKTLLNLGLTFGAVIGLLGAVLLIVGVPVALRFVGLSAGVQTLAAAFRWVVLIGGAFLAFAALYRIGPHRRGARFKWLSGGALVAVILWVGGSALFSVYVATLASYDSTYGTLGGVVVLLMWLYLTAFAILLGAEVNAELERQTAEDTTKGPARPMGERGAYAADTLGEALGKPGYDAKTDPVAAADAPPSPSEEAGAKVGRDAAASGGSAA